MGLTLSCPEAIPWISVVVFCVAPAPFCVALLFFCGRNANLAGRFAGRRWCRFLVGFLSCCFVFVSMMCLGCEAKEFLTTFTDFYCFSHRQDRALERDRPQQRKKKGTSCATPHGHINCPADIVPSYK